MLILTGWWYTYPSEKWWSSPVGMMTFPIWWESHKSPYINHVFPYINHIINPNLPNHQSVSPINRQLCGSKILTLGAVLRFSQGMDGLLGVAIGWLLIVSQWIIPENSLRKTHQSVNEMRSMANPHKQAKNMSNCVPSISLQKPTIHLIWRSTSDDCV